MLRINMVYNKGILFIRLNGKLISSTVGKINDFLIKTINKHNINKLIYNLDNLYALDQDGEKLIKDSIKAIKKNNGRVLLASSSITINVSKFDKILVTDEKNAVKIINSFI